MVTNCPQNLHKGFSNFEDAKDWLFEQGHQTFHFVAGCSDGPKSRTERLNDHMQDGKDDAHREWYAVAKGQSPGIYSNYK